MHKQTDMLQKLAIKVQILCEQGLFHPQVVVVDNFPDDQLWQEEMTALKNMTATLGAMAWVTLNDASDNLAKRMEQFDQILTLIPDKDGGTLVRSKAGEENVIVGRLNKENLIRPNKD